MKIINLLEQVVGNPQTIDGVIDRMVLRISDPQNKDAYFNDSLCHSVTADYAKTGKDTDTIVFLGTGKMVYHSIVVDRYGNIVEDSMKHKSPTLDKGVYTVNGHKINILKELPVKEFKKMVNK